MLKTAIAAFLPATPPACDLYHSLYGGTGRSRFRAPFQVRFDIRPALAEGCDTDVRMPMLGVGGGGKARPP